MTIIKAVLFFFKIQSSHFQVFAHSYMCLLASSLAPRLSSPLICVHFCIHAHTHSLSHLHSQVLTSCGKSSSLIRKEGRKGHPFENKPTSAAHLISSQPQPQDGKLKRQSQFCGEMSSSGYMGQLRPMKVSVRYLIY